MALQGAAALRAQINSVMPTVIASGLLVSLCTIQTPTGGFTTSGAPVNSWANVVGLVEIPCIDAPQSEAVTAGEVKQVAETEAKNFRHVLLNGCYPALNNLKAAGQVRAVLTDELGNIATYEVTGVEDDSQAQMTRFECQAITV